MTCSGVRIVRAMEPHTTCSRRVYRAPWSAATGRLGAAPSGTRRLLTALHGRRGTFNTSSPTTKHNAAARGGTTLLGRLAQLVPSSGTPSGGPRKRHVNCGYCCRRGRTVVPATAFRRSARLRGFGLGPVNGFKGVGSWTASFQTKKRSLTYSSITTLLRRTEISTPTFDPSSAPLLVSRVCAIDVAPASHRSV